MTRNDYSTTDEGTLHTKRGFLLYTVFSFVLLAGFLWTIDFVPELRVEDKVEVPTIVVTTQEPTQEEIEDIEEETASHTVTVPREEPVTHVATGSQVPIRIVIERIGVDTPVLSPASTDIDVLDRALLSGAVLYPGSGEAGENANMLIFGHSSYLPVVNNQAFKAFNELSKLSDGDIVHVYSESHTYSYRINDVWLARAEETVISFEASAPTLTLATCNTFGAKQERWIATAELLRTEQL